MKLVNKPRALASCPRPICIAAGFFDGLHRGHMAVIETALRCARSHGGAAWILTFDVHPLRILRPEQAPPLLTSLDHRLRLFQRTGADGCLLLPFTETLAHTPPDAFARSLLDDAPTIREILVGDDWRFGKDAGGSTDILRAIAGPRDVAVLTVPPVLHGSRPISSTRLRELVARGRLREAGDLLGRPVSFLATVVPGLQRGRQLGFPTANLALENEARPPPGVYVVRAVLDDAPSPLPGVLNLGVRPTFNDPGPPSPIPELHLFDWSGDLYGHTVEVLFLRKLRPERTFPSQDTLQRQIARDIDTARKVLKAESAPNGD